MKKNRKKINVTTCRNGEAVRMPRDEAFLVCARATRGDYFPARSKCMRVTNAILFRLRVVAAKGAADTQICTDERQDRSRRCADIADSLGRRFAAGRGKKERRAYIEQGRSVTRFPGTRRAGLSILINSPA